jgi:hypothetical protein
MAVTHQMEREDQILYVNPKCETVESLCHIFDMVPQVMDKYMELGTANYELIRQCHARARLRFDQWDALNPNHHDKREVYMDFQLEERKDGMMQWILDHANKLLKQYMAKIFSIMSMFGDSVEQLHMRCLLEETPDISEKATEMEEQTSFTIDWMLGLYVFALHNNSGEAVKQHWEFIVGTQVIPGLVDYNSSMDHTLAFKVSACASHALKMLASLLSIATGFSVVVDRG